VTTPGLEALVSRPGRWRGLRLGLITNASAVTRGLRQAILALRSVRGLRLSALFAPEHGLWADAQDLVEVEDARDPVTGLPVFSLYGQTRVPTRDMLEGVDALLFDVQDVGTRYYTFLSTLLLALEACAAHGRRLVVLDRPNPLGGVLMDGNVLDPAYLSFVGAHPIPVRHGLTLGELALLFRDERELKVDVTVVRLRGWRRAMHFEDTGLPWVMTSPNMPTVDTAFVYPGGCLVEGTNLSEGRGTTRPFELVGAPWLDPWRLAAELESERIPGVRFRPLFFRPAFHKHAGRPCGGVQVHVTDRRRFPAYLAYLLLIFHARRLDPARFAWRDPPYEYERVRPPLDVLCGTDRVRRCLDAGRSPRTLLPSWKEEMARFRRRRAPYLLY
jgi:uncharacterized protein YbbC (DUF1343 family)